MPRVTAAERAPLSRSAAPRTAQGRTPAKTRAKKPAPPQDRLSARTLFLRRVRRSLRPGLWFLAAAVVLLIVSELIRSLPARPGAHEAASPAPAAHHAGFGLASLAAALGFRISQIDVEGAKTTDPASLAQAIGVTPGEPSLGFSLDAVQQRVEQLGPVQSATVERILPGTLKIHIVERDAAAIWQTGGDGAQAKFLLIDKAGNVITDQSAAAAKRREPWLLLLVGGDAPQHAGPLMDALHAAPSVLSQVAAAERVDGLRWNLILKDQTVVKLPVEGEAGAIAELAKLQASMRLLDRPVEMIDLRQPGRLVVRPYPSPDAAKDPKAAQKKGAKSHE